MSHKKYPINNPIYFDDMPIGSVTGFHPNIVSPPLEVPFGWAYMDGQTIDDPDSPLDGVTLPDWNSSGRFLRGTTGLTGTEQLDAFQGHWHDIDFNNSAPGGVATNLSGNTSPQLYTSEDDVKDPVSDGVNGEPRTDDETRPINVAVKWILKYKEASAQANHIKVRTLEYEELIPAYPVKTYEIIFADGAVTPTSNDHTAFVQSATATAVSIPDGFGINSEIKVVADGTADVDITGTGLTDATATAGEARTYVWSGTAWLLGSGGGGGALGDLYIPQPKDWVQKYTGSTTSIANSWGVGYYRFTIQRTVSDDDEYTALLNVTDLTADVFSPKFGQSNSGSASSLNVNYVSASNSFIVSTGTTEAEAITRIERWELDTTNVAVQLAPADPALIKDWVLVFDDDDNTANILDQWGVGYYKIITTQSATVGGNGTTFLMQVDDVTVHNDTTTRDPTSTDNYRVRRNIAGEWTVSILGAPTQPYIKQMYRWQDVAAQDAQMSPPVDGWEIIYDEPAGTEIEIINSWGLGWYRFEYYNNTLGYSVSALINLTDVTNTIQSGVNSGNASSNTNNKVRYASSTISFDFQGADTKYFRKIWKFNSLVNVYHSYELDNMTGLNIPQPKTWVEKWTGAQDSVTNQWGTGLYIVLSKNDNNNWQAQSPILYVKDLNTRVTVRITGTTSSNNVDTAYNEVTNSFEVIGNGTTVVEGVTSILRWETDTENLPIQEIPADPALIKDWTQKYSDDGTLGALSVINSWGIGKYMVTANATSVLGGITAIFDLESLDEEYSLRNNSGTTDRLTIKYDTATNSFAVDEVGTVWVDPYISEIKRWEDVAGADAQLSVPVDGWETIYEDLDNIADVPNQWGEGLYEVSCSESTTSMSFPCTLVFSIDNPGNTWRSPFFQRNTAGGYYVQSSATGDFTIIEIDTPLATAYIKKIRKFNSLVNVLHSYHPDPRSVAQKDWVVLLDDETVTGATNTYKVPDGKYRVILRGGTIQYTSIVIVDNTKTTCSGSWTTTGIVTYTTATGTWNSGNVSYPPNYIERWQDSQANDAPSTVLEDGWKLVYESETDQDTVLMSELSDGGIGLYKFYGNCNYGINVDGSWQIEVRDLSADCQIPGGSGGANGDSYWGYDKDVQGFQHLPSGGNGVLAIREVWKFTGLLRISANYNVTSLSDGENQVLAINTDAGDQQVTLPSDPVLGQLFEAWNTGSNGNYVDITTDGSTLYNGLQIGDKKGLKLRYIDGWKYEDVIIVEYTDSTTVTSHDQYIKRWSGGAMTINTFQHDGNSTQQTIYSVPFIGDVPRLSGMVRRAAGGSSFIKTWGDTLLLVNTVAYSDDGTTQTDPRWINAEGRWKAGE